MKLVENAGQAWRWFSVQAMAAALAVEGTWLVLPEDLKSRIPETWADVLTAALVVLGILGRMVDQEKRE